MGLISEGGCVEGLRYLDKNRVALAAEDTSITGVLMCRNIIIAVGIVGDDMNTIIGDYVLRWRNKTDDPSGSWNTLSASGEIKWGSDTVLVNGNAVVVGESVLTFNDCPNPDDWVNGIEREGAVLIDDFSLVKKYFTEFHWAIDLSSSDGVNGDEYEFQLYDPEDTEVLVTFTATIIVTECGTISGVTKDKDGTPLGSCEVAVFEVVSETPPTTYRYYGKTTSDGSGNYSFTECDKLKKYMVFSIKDASPHVFDATDNELVPT